MNPQENASRFAIAPLAGFVEGLFSAAGLDYDKAAMVAEILIEADMMGHSTHGLALAPAYLDAATTGSMTRSGEPDVVVDRGACITWRGKRLPGPWLTARAVDLALDRVKTYGTVTMAISDSHHIGALVAYLPRATRRGYMLMDVNRDRVVGEWWYVDTVASPSNIETFGTAFEVRSGENRLRPSAQTPSRANPPLLAP